MKQYKDGSFGEIEDAKELLEELQTKRWKELEELQAIHFGTKEELQAKKIEHLEAEIERLNSLLKKTSDD